MHRWLNFPINRTFRRYGRNTGRLIRHYFYISLLLISGGLITSGILEIYFQYLESREQLAVVQRVVASATAFKIEQFVTRIEDAMESTCKSREIAENGI